MLSCFMADFAHSAIFFHANLWSVVSNITVWSNIFKRNVLIIVVCYPTLSRSPTPQGSDPAEMKAITKPLEKSFWPEDLQYNAMKEALLAKFQQNDRLRFLLKDTGDRKMIECNKYDTYWGNGRSIFHKEARYGNGQNKLGELLEEVRSLLP